METVPGEYLADPACLVGGSVARVSHVAVPYTNVAAIALASAAGSPFQNGLIGSRAPQGHIALHRDLSGETVRTRAKEYHATSLAIGDIGIECPERNARALRLAD